MARLRARAAVGNPDDLEIPAPQAKVPPPAAQPKPQQPAPAAQAITPPTPAGSAPARPAPAATPTAGPLVRAAVTHAPDLYPSDLVPKVPSEPLPATSPVKTIVAARPAETLSPLDRRAKAIDNLRRVGMALNQYVARHGTLPAPAIRNDRGQATLSWRVAILSELGYDELLRQFRLFEPWDSPHNQQLLAQIPPELQSPERPDTTTNFVAAIGPDAAFQGIRGAAPKSFLDGAENTIIIVEADDRHAVPWTRPADLAVAPSNPRQGLGGLRGDGFLALLADGRVKRVPPELPGVLLGGLFTVDSGEALVAAEVLKEPTLEPAAVAASPPDLLAELLSAAPKPTPPDPSSAIGRPKVADADLSRLPIPDHETLLKSRAALRDLYGKEVQAARTPDERSRLAARLLGESTKVEASAADFYELVRIARDMAAAVGDAASAIKADELLTRKYQIDPLAARLKLLRDLSGSVRVPQVAGALAQRSKELLVVAYEQDDYETAIQTFGLLTDYVKLQGDRAEVVRLQKMRPILEAARQSFATIPEQLKKLEADPNDADANEAVGKYLCMVKNRWEAGLPLLVRCGDIQLRIVATMDLEPVRAPSDTLKLADQYWDMADDYKQPFTRGLHLRAVYQYQMAAAQLAGSFDRLRAQKKLDEAIAMYGKDDIERSLGRATATSTGSSIPVLPASVSNPAATSGPRGVPVPGT
jgi:hypothetical protein